MSCGACGIRDFKRNNILYNEFSINQLDILKFSDKQKREYNNNKKQSVQIPIKKNNKIKIINITPIDVKSCWTDPNNKTLYYLYPELIY